jgi:hypothetical protein
LSALLKKIGSTEGLKIGWDKQNRMLFKGFYFAPLVPTALKTFYDPDLGLRISALLQNWTDGSISFLLSKLSLYLVLLSSDKIFPACQSYLVKMILWNPIYYTTYFLDRAKS